MPLGDGTLVIDMIEGARIRESQGVAVEAMRVAIVHGIAGSAATGEEVFEAALTATGMPVAGDVHPIYGDLVLQDRRAVMVGSGSTRQVRVDLVYKHPSGGEIQTPPGDNYVLSGGSAVEQVESEIDRQTGQQITVEHNGDVQGGTVAAFESRSVISFEATWPSAAPLALSQTLTNRVNDQQWAGGAPRTWLITDVGFTLVDPLGTLGTPTYRFRFELRYNPDGHDPTVVYIDPDTGRPPPGLTNLGLKTIEWYDDFDFTFFD